MSEELVVVPHLVGRTVPEARGIANGLGLVVVAGDPDGPPLGALTWPGTWRVTAQDPVAGYPLPRGAPVVIEFEQEDGGEAGDREPRRPSPRPGVRSAELDPDGQPL